MNAKEAQDAGIELSDIELAVKIWAHEVIEELEDDMALEEHFKHCLQIVPPANEESEELVVA